MLEDPFGQSEEAKLQRCYWRRVGLLIFGVMLFAGLTLALLLYPKKVWADPRLRAEAGGISVTLYDEKCALKEITNLPFRATWTENGKTQEGCMGAFDQMGLFILYFSDKTVIPIPMQMFTRVVGA